MKNLKKTFLDHRLDRVIFLSRREAKFLAGHEPRRYYDRPGLYHAVDGVDIYRRIDYALKRFLNKHIDDAFEYFSSFVPWYQKKIFWDHVEYLIRPTKYGYNRYYLNKDGVIRSVRRKPVVVVYKSLDYVEEYQHKVNKLFIDDPYWEFRTIHKNEFEKVIRSGYRREFASRKDPRYIQLVTNDRKTLRKQKRNEHEKRNADLLNIFNESLSQSYRTKSSN